MKFWKEFFDIIQAAITSIGIVIGGIWTYLLFVRQRLAFPKVDINLCIDAKLLPEGSRLIHAELKIVNIGNVIFKSNYAELRLRQVVPVPDNLIDTIKNGFDPVPDGRTEIEWPMIAGREWKWSEGGFEIEPGESDSLHADYVIPKNIKILEFYFYISNAQKKRHGLGWTHTELYEFDKDRGER